MQLKSVKTSKSETCSITETYVSISRQYSPISDVTNDALFLWEFLKKPILRKNTKACKQHVCRLL